MDKELKQRISKRFKVCVDEIRQSTKYKSQKLFAEKIGVEYTYFNGVYIGKTPVSIEFMFLLRKHFNTDINYLFNEEENVEKKSNYTIASEPKVNYGIDVQIELLKAQLAEKERTIQVQEKLINQLMEGKVSAKAS